MLSEERNALLTRVGGETPMGRLLRRYWHPIAPVLELIEKRVKPIRLLGEDLVLFRTRGEGYGLIDRRCPHRGVDLSYGWVDGDHIRCPYHGWAFDNEGRCVAQPFEESGEKAGFREKIRTSSYRTAALGGLIWAYLGPEPAPLLPDFEPFHWDHGFVEISITELPCNWFQCHENGVDPVHFEWLHTNWAAVRENPQEPKYGATHLAIEFAEFEFGFICGREIAAGENVRPPTSSTNRISDGGFLCMWPYVLVTGPTMEWRVPIDDTHTLNIERKYSVLPNDVTPIVQAPETIPYWYGPLTAPGSDRVLTSHVLNQDFAAWVGQGAIADRSREHLGRTDTGIIRLRRRYFEEMERVAQGEDPAGTVRRAGKNHRIQLPIFMKSRFTQGISRGRYEDEIAWQRKWNRPAEEYDAVQAGRPERIGWVYDEIAGIADHR